MTFVPFDERRPARRAILALALVPLALAAAPASAQKHYDDGASDTTIRIGNVTPKTGAFAEFGVEARAQAAYFKMVNDHGGVNGRQIEFISVDDGSDQRKSPRLAAELVEQQKVLLLFSTFGVVANPAIRGYANEHHVPQLFVQNSSAIFDDPAHYPWTMGFFASYRTEARAYGRYIAETKPDAKVGILYANDESGREFIDGLREILAGTTVQIVREAPFRYGTPATIDAQIDALQGAGADVFVNLAFGRYGSQAIAHAYDIGWRPLQLIPNASLSIAAFLDPAGLEKARGVVSNARSKGYATNTSRSDPAVAAFVAWMHDYLPEASLRDSFNIAGYERAQVLVEVLRRCGDELTRANVMKQAASLDLEIGMLRPGIRVTTSATDYQPIKQLYLVRFDGRDWAPLRGISGS